MSVELKTTDVEGKSVGTVSMDEQVFGGFIKNKLMHSAAVVYHANMRQGSHCTKSRGAIAGSTHKLYRQKGTGRARAGTRKSGTRKGGGVIHGPHPRDYSTRMPKKQRRAALRSAILSKAKDGELHLVQDLDLPEPKTKGLLGLLEAHKLHDTALIATDGMKRNMYLSGRNLPGISVIPARELNARQVLLHKNLVMDQAAFERLNQATAYSKASRKPKGSRKQKSKSGTDSKE